jgi:hypothetical protein
MNTCHAVATPLLKVFMPVAKPLEYFAAFIIRQDGSAFPKRSNVYRRLALNNRTVSLLAADSI